MDQKMVETMLDDRGDDTRTEVRKKICDGFVFYDPFMRTGRLSTPSLCPAR